MQIGKRATFILLVAGSALGLAACAYDDYGYGYGPGYGDYRYDGRDFDHYADGADMLDPWLADTEEGRAIVAMGFRGDDSARRANAWFRRYADTDDDLRLTDAEIRLALVQGARGY